MLRWPEGDAGAGRAAVADDRLAGRSASSVASSCRRSTKATCSTCRRALPGLSAAKGRRAAAADRPPDQDRARSRARIRQGRPRRNGHRSGAAGDVRDDHPASSRATSGAPGMTPDKLVEELDRAVKVPGLANIWVPADPQPHRHAGHRHQEPHRRQGVGHRSAGRSTGLRGKSSGSPSRCRA